MAHTIYYDSVGSVDVTINDGTGTTSFTDTSTITNEEYANDESILYVVGGLGHNAGNKEALLFDLGSAKTVDFCAYYCNDDDSNSLTLDVAIYQGSATGSLSQAGSTNTSSNLGWNIIGFSDTTSRYWTWVSVNDRFQVLTEVFFGNKLEIDRPGIGRVDEEMYSTYIQQTYNGTEYSNKIDQPVTQWTLELPIIDSDLKSGLESFQDTVQNRYKFVYYDESSYHWVRLVEPLQFDQIGTNAYTTTLVLREQFE